MQRWSVMLKEGDRKRFLQVQDACMNWMKAFKPNMNMPSDAFEL
jgi:hypothetical protein